MIYEAHDMEEEGRDMKRIYCGAHGQRRVGYVEKGGQPMA